MRTIRFFWVSALACGLTALPAAAEDDVERLVAAMLGDTPIIDDLRELTDDIGGRPTGSDANRKAVAWAVEKLRQAEVSVTTEDFEMPFQWQEKLAFASISGDVSFDPHVVAKPFSTAADARVARLVDGGSGSADDFKRVGDAVKGAWVLIETPELNDDIGLAGLFGLYGNARQFEARANAAEALGVVQMSPYPKNLVYRQFASTNYENDMPLLVMDREHALRALRLMRSGRSLSLGATISIDAGYSYSATNVIAEIPGTSRADEIVLFGAHLDSFDLGTGALDNGVNVAMLINLARQITRLGLKPERTIRFALWNGEEQALVGSWKYTEQHEDELDDHVVAASFDIGSGRTTGFFPFQQIDVPLVGTDNFDFMIEGVPNLIAIQSDANYASNYHAESDTFEKVDQYQVRLNSAIAAAVVWGFANDSDRLPRQTHDEVEDLVDSTNLEQQMKDFSVWDGWADGTRGQHD
jgi:hypothetical protein